MKCEDCVHWWKTGETWVPYGSGDVKLSDDYDCSQGWGPDGCEGTDYERKDEITLGGRVLEPVMHDCDLEDI